MPKYRPTPPEVPAAEVPTDRGHRLAVHDLQWVVESWGPDRRSCLAEALAGAVEAFARVGDAAATDTLPVAVGPAPDVDLLRTLLDEVLGVIDVFGVVPVRFHLADTDDGGLAGDMEVVEAAEAELTGPAPAAVSCHGLQVTGGSGGWRCRAVLQR